MVSHDRHYPSRIFRPSSRSNHKRAAGQPRGRGYHTHSLSCLAGSTALKHVWYCRSDTIPIYDIASMWFHADDRANTAHEGSSTAFVRHGDTRLRSRRSPLPLTMHMKSSCYCEIGNKFSKVLSESLRFHQSESPACVGGEYQGSRVVRSLNCVGATPSTHAHPARTFQKGFWRSNFADERTGGTFGR